MLAPDEALLLDRLTLGAGPAATLPMSAGVRRARTRGAGVEFHEFRPYQAGDDPRAIDWTVEARLRQLVVRVSRAEGHLRLHVLIDTSASMSIGQPTKLTLAKRVAAALCYVAVQHRDAAGVSTFRDRVNTAMPPAEGRAQLFRAFETIAPLAPSGRSDIDRALEQYAAAARGPGVVAVLSDYFQSGAGLRGLQCLLGRGLTPAVLQVIAPEEIAPDFSDDTELLDVEQAGTGPVVVDGTAMSAYLAGLAQHEATLRTFCAAHGCTWTRLVSGMSFRELLAALETSGVLGSRA